MNRNEFQQYLDSLPTKLNEGGVKKVLKLQESVKINLYPGKMGVDIEGDPDSSDKVITVPLSKLVRNEPAAKMLKTGSKQTVKDLHAAIKKGTEMDPLLVMQDGDKYKILDGHHRYTALKLAKKDEAKVIVVPEKDITKVDKEGNPLK